jgi:hypothetical protein
MRNPYLKFNTLVIVCLFLAIFVIQLVNYVFVRIEEGVLPMGRLVFGLSVYGSLALLYWRNHWLPRVWMNRWVLLYCGYIILSFLYGYKRYGTISTSIFDLWLFLFVPAIALIPPYSFNVRVFDRMLAIGVLFSVAAMAVVAAIKSAVLYDRIEFSFYIAPLAALGAGAGYLLLKNAKHVNLHTYIGLFGVLSNAVLYGVVGAFRGQMILSILLVLLFLLIQFRTIHIDFGWKFLSFIGMAAGLIVVVILVFTSFQEQMYTMLGRFTEFFDAFAVTGEAASADARLGELQYFMQLNSSWKLIPGHGVGGLWYDFYGMFGDAQGGAFEGARTLLHINWLHFLFKIGIIGFGLMIGLLVHNYRQYRAFIRGNHAWWCFLIFYLAWTTYYGDKDLNPRSMLFLIVLIHPWLFLPTQFQRVEMPPRGARPDRRR